MFKNVVFVFFLFASFYMNSQNAAYKQLKKPTDNLSNDIQYWNTPSCYRYLESITSTHERIHSMYESELNSSFLKEVHFYTAPESPIYVVVKFYQNPRYYIYCEVPGFEVDNFLPESYLTYGEKFNEYIAPYKCNCR